MKAEKLKERIIKKFGTVSEFGRAANVDRYYLQTVLKRKRIPEADYVNLLQKCLSIRFKQRSDVIPPSRLRQLKTAINAAGGVYAFCLENEEFKDRTREVYLIYAGKRSLRSKLVRRLFQVLFED